MPLCLKKQQQFFVSYTLDFGGNPYFTLWKARATC